MNLTWHLAKKDLRRLRLPLALYAFLLAAPLLLGARLLRTNAGELPVERFDQIGSYIQTFVVAGMVVAYVLVAAIVHEDSLVGTAAFWMTKPISGGRLLGAKTLVLAISLIALPVLVALPWWIACGFQLGEIGRAALVLALGQGVLIGIALPFAVLTGTSGRYLSATLVLLSAFAVGVLYFVTSRQGGAHASALSAGAKETRGWLLALLAIVSIAALVVHHYTTRRFVRSLGILVTGGVAAAVLFASWRWDWSARAKPSPTVAPDLKITLESAGIRPNPAHSATVDLVVQVRGEGVPADYQLLGGGLQETWRWPGGPELKLDGAWQLVPGAPMDSSSGSVRAVTQLPRALANRAATEPLEVSLDCHFILLKNPRELREIPVVPGVTASVDSRTLRIVAVDRTAEKRTAIIETMPGRLAEGFTLTGRALPKNFAEPQAASLILVGPAHDLAGFSEPIFSRSLTLAGVSVIWRTEIFRYVQWDAATAQWSSVPEPPADSRLAIRTYQSIEEVHRQVEAHGLTLATLPAKAAASLPR